ncbi:MAG: hypothetical protein ACREQR_12555 [Candidatus Binataceae bacterium]
MPTSSKKPRREGAAIILAMLILLAATAVHARQYHVDQGSSAALTKYLHKHRLPLVGAQVMRDDAGTPQLNLYGFVATDAGRADAVRKAERFLSAGEVPVVNSIQVNPSINSHGADDGAANAPPGSATAPNSSQQWSNAMQGIYKNGAQPLPSPGAPNQP